MTMHRVMTEVWSPDDATHYGGELTDDPLFYKMIQVGAAGDHWFSYSASSDEWEFVSHTEPAWIKPLPQVLPPPDAREDGLEVLAFHRGKWTHVRWVAAHGSWILGYGGAFIEDGGRAFAPLPEKPEGADGFYDWRR